MTEMPKGAPMPSPEKRERTQTEQDLDALKQRMQEKERGILKEVLARLDRSPQSQTVRKVMVERMKKSLTDPKQQTAFDAKEPLKYSMEDLMNGLSEVTLRQNPDLIKKIQTGQVSLLEAGIGGLESLFNEAITQAETLPEAERKTRIADLNAAKKTMLGAVEELK